MVQQSVHVFWGVVALLALAAAGNHARHHTRRNHLSLRLARASARHGETRMLRSEGPAGAFDPDV